MEITRTQYLNFLEIFLKKTNCKFKFSDKRTDNEIENIKNWVSEITDDKGNTLQDKLYLLSQCIQYVDEDIKNKKYNGKIYSNNDMPNSVKYYSWANMRRMKNIASEYNFKINKKDNLLNKRGDKEQNISDQDKYEKELKFRESFKKYVYEAKEKYPEWYTSIMERSNGDLDSLPINYVVSFMKVQSNIKKIDQGLM